MDSQLDELLGEKQRLYPMRAHVPLVMNLLDGEIIRIQSLMRTSSSLAKHEESFLPIPDQQSFLETSMSQRMLSANGLGSGSKKRIKLMIPVDRYPDYNFVGRLLGPRGATLKHLEKETGCRIMIRGKGSIRKEKENDVRGKPGYEHAFSKPLHVIIETDMRDAAGSQALSKAAEIIESLLMPPPDDRESAKLLPTRELGLERSRSMSMAQSVPSFSVLSQGQGMDNFSVHNPGLRRTFDRDQDDLSFQMDDLALSSDQHVVTHSFPSQPTLSRTVELGSASSRVEADASGEPSESIEIKRQMYMKADELRGSPSNSRLLAMNEHSLPSRLAGGGINQPWAGGLGGQAGIWTSDDYLATSDRSRPQPAPIGNRAFTMTQSNANDDNDAIDDIGDLQMGFED
uniref:K Homology domain-containing protein n=1 Tax=Rhodosorus marinus TaxID=101924 RepID=A0A7S2ZG30_9RHOD